MGRLGWDGALSHGLGRQSKATCGYAWRTRGGACLLRTRGLQRLLGLSRTGSCYLVFRDGGVRGPSTPASRACATRRNYLQTRARLPASDTRRFAFVRGCQWRKWRFEKHHRSNGPSPRARPWLPRSPAPRGIPVCSCGSAPPEVDQWPSSSLWHWL